MQSQDNKTYETTLNTSLSFFDIQKFRTNIDVSTTIRMQAIVAILWSKFAKARHKPEPAIIK
jgi:hypothetical protein